MLNAEDKKHHALALEANKADRPILTSAWVLLELADHLCDSHNRHLLAEVLDALRNDRRVTIVNVDQALLDRAIDLYRRRPDKDWSLTDCTSFVLMADRGVAEALTADHHFEQAGFVALLKS